MFWRKKIPKCKHEWHYLKDDYIYNNLGAAIDADDACWILCVKCENEKLVYKEEWERVKRKQEILKEFNK
ncbi:hypothetical protein D3Z17_09565 [Bacillus subtilis]|uniref:hypothetical protein n=1 Tax=Bacillus TaxID=1386 RepID=UPI000DEEFD14|nr:MULTISPECIES: hypothetical protein [Bacillus]MBW4823278.1 hypothetical protein [Bacillaceae bacterium]AXF33380.1 hypothetical protein DS740_11270 [Bacillus sp. DM2]AYF11344.1 hypothetical protein D3Z17_09565 [Bacillus subtilis]QAR83787.1 hypothetical protein EQI56_10970 [Bacillus subtilis]WIW62951.1 hypothetical protein LSG27_12150 [Bacillus subtilis]